ncbi:hypothetical protein Fot_37534 [Forsythia ovata]|uniref:Uncharacterized protein n=1 Tax=Forsythia ovata TaxID=205694 RepID=A0ABD1S1N3_9LAMI
MEVRVEPRGDGVFSLIFRGGVFRLRLALMEYPASSSSSMALFGAAIYPLSLAILFHLSSCQTFSDKGRDSSRGRVDETSTATSDANGTVATGIGTGHGIGGCT